MDFMTFLPFGICVILPVCVICFSAWRHVNADIQRKEMFLAALEKNPGLDPQEFFKHLEISKKPLKLQLLNKLLVGCSFTFLSICLAFFSLFFFLGTAPIQLLYLCILVGVVCFAVGLAFLLNYVVGKKMLAREIEAETVIRTKE